MSHRQARDVSIEARLKWEPWRDISKNGLCRVPANNSNDFAVSTTKGRISMPQRLNRQYERHQYLCLLYAGCRYDLHFRPLDSSRGLM
jgi:hypothetical protein